ncbi:MAG TPA: sugar ABC transporter permease [Petrotogaceae bacterium]|nr:sugar ABC transporter permease [Petrotogaceae bacterium]
MTYRAFSKKISLQKKEIYPKKQLKAASLFLFPTVFAITVSTVIPSLYNIFISFTNYGLNHYFEYDFIGIENYKKIFNLTQNSPFFPVLLWTIAWMVLSTLLNYFIGMFIAIFLNNPNLPERNIYRGLLIIPWALPGVIAIQMWHGMLGTEGVLNQFLGMLGIEAVSWFNSVFWSRFWVIIVNAWISFPYFMTITYAALQSIPTDLYEAAEIDGAGKAYKFRKITLPLLNKTLSPLIITQFAFQFNNFNLIFLLTRGGPRNSLGDYFGSTDILVSYTFNIMRELQQYGLTAAYGVITFFITVLIIVFTTLCLKGLKEEF